MNNKFLQVSFEVQEVIKTFCILPDTEPSLAWLLDEQECGEHLKLVPHRVQKQRKKSPIAL